MKSPAVVAFWGAFKQATGVTHDRYDVAAFGDSVEMQDELAELVLRGIKRATAPLLRDFTAHGLPPPAVGDLVVVVDGRGEPRCVYRVISAEARPFDQVDAAFAYREGEGDRSLGYWVRAHTDYYLRQAAVQQFDFHREIEVVLECFVVVWPALRGT